MLRPWKYQNQIVWNVMSTADHRKYPKGFYLLVLSLFFKVFKVLVLQGRLCKCTHSNTTLQHWNKAKYIHNLTEMVLILFFFFFQMIGKKYQQAYLEIQTGNRIHMYLEGLTLHLFFILQLILLEYLQNIHSFLLCSICDDFVLK